MVDKLRPDTSKRIGPAKITLLAILITSLFTSLSSGPPVAAAAPWREQAELGHDIGSFSFLEGFGYTSAVDGNLAVIGSQTNRRIQIHFRDENGDWNLEQVITLSTSAVNLAVAVSEDPVAGDVVAVGNLVDSSGAEFGGAVVIYQRNEFGHWEGHQKLVSSGISDRDRFGSSIAMDGDQMIIGAPEEDSGGIDRGAAYIFARDGSGNWNQQARLQPGDLSDVDEFGRAVDISGNRAIVGVPLSDANGADSGAAYVYAHNGSWQLDTKLAPSDASAGIQFGYSVGISEDTTIVGTRPLINRAYIFHFNGNWSQEKVLFPTTGTGANGFGSAVAIDGNTVAVGAHRANALAFQSGAGWIFGRTQGSSGPDWTVESESGLFPPELTASDGDANFFFGWSAAIQGSTAIFGSLRHDNPDDGFRANGASYVFTGGDYVYVDRRAPAVLGLELQPAFADPNENVSILATADDSRGGNSDVVGADYRIESGPWQPMVADAGSFDSPVEVVAAIIDGGTLSPGKYQVCVRATDGAGNTSKPVCTDLSIKNARVQTTFTITEVRETGSGLDPLGDAELYPRVLVGADPSGLVIPSPGGSFRKDAISEGEFQPFWTFSSNAEVFDGLIYIRVNLWDCDSIFCDDEDPEDDEHADLNPNAVTNSITLVVDASTGTWTGPGGLTWPNNCIQGDDATASVRICWTLNIPPHEVIGGVEFTQIIQRLQTLENLQSDLQKDGKPPIEMMGDKPAAMRVYLDQTETSQDFTVIAGDTETPITTSSSCTAENRRLQQAGCQSADHFFVPRSTMSYFPLELYDGGGQLLGVQHFVLATETLEPPLMEVSVVEVCEDSGRPLFDVACSRYADFMRNIPHFERSFPIEVEPEPSFFSSTSSVDVTVFGWWIDRNIELIYLQFLEDWAWEIVTLDFLIDSDVSIIHYGTVRGEVDPPDETMNGIGFPFAGLSKDEVIDTAGNPTGRAPGLMSHEIGHALFRQHVPHRVQDFDGDGNNECSGDTIARSDPHDDNWPTFNDPRLEEVGYDVANTRAFDPDNSFDVLSYCTPRWSSIYTRQAVLDCFVDFAVLCRTFELIWPPDPDESAAATIVRALFGESLIPGVLAALVAGHEPEPPPGWSVSGLVQNDGTVHMLPIFETPTRTRQFLHGNYAAQVLGPSDEILYSQPFDPIPVHSDDGSLQAGVFAVPVPTLHTADRVAIVHSGVEMASIGTGGVSPHIPEVSIQGGPVGSGSVRWSVVDTDSQEHAYIVLFSRDGGQHWHVLGLTREPNLNLDFDRLPETNGALIKVMASDGINTTHAISSPFDVDPKPPQAGIAFPPNGSIFQHRDMIWLRGWGYDFDDIPTIGDPIISWSSNLDGFLGSDATLPITNLSVGTHLITLQVQDSDGNIATDEIFVVVVPRIVNETLIHSTGTIVVTKSSEPGGGSGFTFTDDVPGSGGFILNAPGIQVLDDVPAGSYRVTELANPGWRLAEIRCRDEDGGTTVSQAEGRANIDLDAGEVVSCQFFGLQSAGDQPPVAEAGGPYQGSEGVFVDVDGGDSADDNGIISYQWDCDNDGVFEILSDVGTASCTYGDDGHFTATLRVTDTLGQFSQDSATVSISNTAPLVSLIGGAQSVQYSDPIAPLTIIGTDVLADPPFISAEWSSLGGISNPGLPPGFSLDQQGCSTNGLISCGWQLFGVADLSAGDYSLSFSISDGDGGISQVSQVLEVTPEKGLVSFLAAVPAAVIVTEPGGSGAFSLAAEVSESVPDEGSVQPTLPGDVSNASLQVMLNPVGPGLPVAAECIPGSSPGIGYDQVQQFKCDFTNVPVNVYEARAALGGTYYQGAGTSIVTVYDPSLGEATGGGWMAMPGEDPSKKTNFGITGQFTGQDDILRGEISIVKRAPRESGVYRFLSEHLTTMVVSEEEDYGWAVITGSGSYEEPAWEGPRHDYRIIVYLEDWGEPGEEDRIWVHTINPQGMVVESISFPDPATSNAIRIGGGNLSAPVPTEGRK